MNRIEFLLNQHNLNGLIYLLNQIKTHGTEELTSSEIEFVLKVMLKETDKEFITVFWEILIECPVNLKVLDLSREILEKDTDLLVHDFVPFAAFYIYKYEELQRPNLIYKCLTTNNNILKYYIANAVLNFTSVNIGLKLMLDIDISSGDHFIYESIEEYVFNYKSQELKNIIQSILLNYKHALEIIEANAT